MLESSQTITAIASQEVGLQCLWWLLDEGYPLTNVFLGTEEDREIANLCKARDVSCSVFSEESLIRSKDASWLLSLWNPHILTPAGLSKARSRLNLHPALVPYCRGNDTAAWALMTGVPTGVSLLEMDEGVDTGAIWAQRAINVSKTTKGADLLAQMKAELVALFRAEWPGIFGGSVIPKKQSRLLPAYTRKQTNESRVRDLDDFQSAGELFVWLRAHDFAPKSSAELLIDGVRYSVTLNLDALPD